MMYQSPGYDNYDYPGKFDLRALLGFFLFWLSLPFVVAVVAALMLKDITLGVWKWTSEIGSLCYDSLIAIIKNNE